MRTFGLFRSLAVILLIVGTVPLSAAMAEEGAAPTAVEALLRGDGDLRLADRIINRDALLPIYEKRSFAAVWTEERRESLSQALAEAPSHGLDAAAFAMPRATAPAERELLLSDVFLRYAAALAHGRVKPTDYESDWAMPVPGFDGGRVFDRAMSGSVVAVLDALAPSNPAYAKLRVALAQYATMRMKGAGGRFR